MAYLERVVSPVVVTGDGEAADELADSLDGRRHVDVEAVLRNEAVIAVALRRQVEGVALLESIHKI